MLLVNFDLIPVVEPFVFAGSHLEPCKSKARYDGDDECGDENGPSVVDLCLPDFFENIIDARNLHNDSPTYSAAKNNTQWFVFLLHSDAKKSALYVADVAKVRLFGAEFWVAFFYLERDKIGLM